MAQNIPGTTLFDGVQARKGYALNKMCFSFNEKRNRDEFVRDEDAYCARYGLNDEQRAAIRARDVLGLDRRRRQRLLPGQVRRHPGAGRAGPRRVADRRQQGRVQGPPRGRGSRVMARLVGAVATSHVPAIGRAIARNLQADPYWKPFFDGFPPVHAWLDRVKPDVAVVIYNDHGLNFFLDKMPTFAVGAAPEYRNADEGWGIPTVPPFRGELDLSWHLIESLIGDEFDITTCQEMLVDHAFTLPMALLWPGSGGWPVTTVPVCINTVQFPLPSAKRCWALGQAIGRAIASWDSDRRVVVIGTGGLSHQLDGQRAGFINKAFDQKFMASLVDDPTWATRFTTEQLVEQAGTQGIELLMWLATRGALQGARPGAVRQVHSNYHIPISNTAAGLLVLENRD